MSETKPENIFTEMTARPIIDQPREGYFQTRLVRGGPFVPVRIWYSAANDPETGEPLDRSPRWYATCGNYWIEPFAIWPRCCNEPISRDEYHFLIADAEHCALWAPDQPAAQPTRTTDWQRIEPTF